jgi:hypothetical protein
MIVVLDAVNPQVSSFYLALHNRALCTSAVLTGKAVVVVETQAFPSSSAAGNYA